MRIAAAVPFWWIFKKRRQNKLLISQLTHTMKDTHTTRLTILPVGDKPRITPTADCTDNHNTTTMGTAAACCFSRLYALFQFYWCPVKYWSDIVKRGKSGLYKTSDTRGGLTFALCMVSTPLPLTGAKLYETINAGASPLRYNLSSLRDSRVAIFYRTPIILNQL